MSDEFEGLRTQGEINRILEETSDEELEVRFIAYQQTRLERTKRALLRDHASIQEEERQWGEGDHYVPQDPEDVMVHIRAEEVDAVLDSQLMRRLRLVQRALEKIEEGTYGVCDATGERIPRDRLRAVPEAVYTIEVQRTLERDM